MSGKYALAPEFASLPSFTLPSNRLLLRIFNLMVKLQRRGFEWGSGVEVKTHSVGAEDGHGVDVFEIVPRDLRGEAPALIDYHGGGFFLSYAKGHVEYAERYALETRCRVFFPDYRLSIDDPFPAALHDAYETLAWVHDNADRLEVDRSRICLLGDSAGGALAAGVAQMACDRGEHPIRAQILIYPVTDHETSQPSARAYTDTPMWKTASNRNMWKVYLRATEYGQSGASVPIPAYAAPLHRESFEGLPPTFVEVAEFDPLHDEGVAYARALESAGVPVELREVPGAVHGYDLVEGSATAATVLEDRLAAIRRAFSKD
ncbi:MAG: alpha/beta hydrolase [Deltaproteobacteria bacterium]|jgi:acetyl esterase/lipase|nr:alpha/beta hydrolase [Deltaproteobacteria bacterium]MBW2498069.1 alpha/beta hydrolase [Deltaproteobacteria bacterium]